MCQNKRLERSVGCSTRSRRFLVGLMVICGKLATMDERRITVAFGLHTLQLLILSLYLILCPYTKVEESFNIQAIHDILFHGHNLSLYDHREFPGVVPRTFIGPLIISAFSYPIKVVTHYAGLNPILLQYGSRFVLGVFVLHSLWKFNSAVGKIFGKQTANYAALISITQFHLLFYATRPLPNIFALCFTMHSLRFWLTNKTKSFIWVSAFVIIVFRSELAILLGLCLLMSYIFRSLTIKCIIMTSIPAGIAALISTITIDSWFWGYWLWPEGEVLYFNTVLNKSSKWGTLPFLWYFYSALPRMLLGSSLFIPWAIRCYPKRSLLVLCPAIGFVALYSLLPHKELRFIIYTVPLFNVVAANALSNMHNRYYKDIIGKISYIVMVLLLVISGVCCFVFLVPSYYNYPGGFALAKLHDMVPCSKGSMHLYIDNFVAQTGASRFGQSCSNWIYNKTENIELESSNLTEFTHLLLEADEKYSALDSEFQVIHKVNGLKIQSSPPFFTRVVKAVLLQYIGV